MSKRKKAAGSSAPEPVPSVNTSATVHPLLESEVSEWVFLPTAVTSAFEEENLRMSRLQQGFKDALDQLEALARKLTPIDSPERDAGASNENDEGTEAPPEDDGEAAEETEQEKRRRELMQLLREVRRVQFHVLEPKLRALTTGLAYVSGQYETLYQKHRQFSRELICHLTQHSTFLPQQRDGGSAAASLLKNPYVVG